MATVNIQPMPQRVRDTPKWLRPQHPPVFDGNPSPDDIAEARALFLELDDESKCWYGRTGIFAGL